MRSMGAKTTDLIVLVVSAVESVQRQTEEVIDLARAYDVPLVVAINKIDSDGADVEQFILDLDSHGVVDEDLGG